MMKAQKFSASQFLLKASRFSPFVRNLDEMRGHVLPTIHTVTNLERSSILICCWVARFSQARIFSLDRWACTPRGSSAAMSVSGHSLRISSASGRTFVRS
jgi:hypothetical protein